jgi:hypothetical protein
VLIWTVRLADSGQLFMTVEDEFEVVLTLFRRTTIKDDTAAADWMWRVVSLNILVRPTNGVLNGWQKPLLVCQKKRADESCRILSIEPPASGGA